MPVVAALFMDHPAAGGLDSSTTAWINAVVTNGGTVSGARQTLVNSLITGLKTDGVWAILDRLFIFAAENEPSARTDMVAASLSTKTGAPTFTTDRGYTAVTTGDGIDTGFNPSTAGGNFTQNSAHHSVWSNTTAATSNTRLFANSILGSDYSHIYAYFPGGIFYNRICSSAGAGFTVTDSRGHFLGNRSASGATQSYYNGSSVGSDTQASSALINATYAVSNDLFNSVSNLYQVPMVSLGGSLSSTQAANFYTRLRTYMTAVGVP